MPWCLAVEEKLKERLNNRGAEIHVKVRERDKGTDGQKGALKPTIGEAFGFAWAAANWGANCARHWTLKGTTNRQAGLDLKVSNSSCDTWAWSAGLGT